MYQVSANFLGALTTSHQMVVSVDAYYNGALTLADIPVDDGSVTVDRTSKVRRTLALTVADPTMLPWDATDPLAVYGQQLVVSRGIRYPDGTTEMCPLGTFRIDTPGGDVDLGPLTLTGSSAEVTVQDDAFTVPVSTSGMGGCADVITALIQQTIPAAVVVNATAGARNPACAVTVWDAQSDRWDAITQVATAMNAEVYVDASDRFVIADPPTLPVAPVWTVAAGEGGVMIDPTRTMQRASVTNAVFVSGENTATGGAPVSGVAYDSDPTSPTRWGGPFGQVPYFYSSSLFTTGAACTAAAQTMLANAIMANIETSISTVPNPALDGGDVIEAQFLSGRKELYIAQSFAVPLTVDGDFPITLQGGKVTTS